MAKSDKKSIASSSSNSSTNQGTGAKWALPLLVLVAIVAVAFIIYQANKDSGNNTAKTSNTTNNSSSNSSNFGNANVGDGTLSVDPGSQSVANGSEISLLIYENSGEDAVNAVQSNLTYPTNKFDLVKIDTSGSAFAIKAQEDGGGGSIKIARGTINPMKGKQLVAKVDLRAKAGIGTADIEFASGSGIVRASDNKEILHDSNGATYTLTQ